MIATQRQYGWTLTAIIGVFLVYLFIGPKLPTSVGHPGVSFNRIVSNIALGTEGIFGSPWARRSAPCHLRGVRLLFRSVGRIQIFMICRWRHLARYRRRRKSCHCCQLAVWHHFRKRGGQHRRYRHDHHPNHEENADMSRMLRARSKPPLPAAGS